MSNVQMRSIDLVTGLTTTPAAAAAPPPPSPKCMGAVQKKGPNICFPKKVLMQFEKYTLG